METFMQQHRACVKGAVSGFDRVIFRGTLRSISYAAGLDKFLGAQHVLYKDFKGYAMQLTNMLATHAKNFAAKHQRPYEYLASSSISKEARACEIAERDGITAGLICVLSCVEPCRTFTVRSSRDDHRLKVVNEERRCLFFYFYFFDREFGLMHVRVQSWIPFQIQVYINGRSYLARQLEHESIAFNQHGNCFTHIDDLDRAQALLDMLARRRWERTLNKFARQAFPLLAGPLEDLHGYYWTIRESEHATDVMFRSADDLQALYPALIHHAITQMSCHDVLRFLGRKQVTRRFNGEVHVSYAERGEGVRVKHVVNRNSIKMYNKAGSVLRIETTINDPHDMRVVRRTDDGSLARKPLRKGIVDTLTRVNAARAANGRYLEALAVVGDDSPCHTVLDPLTKPATSHGRTYRALRPTQPDDAQLLALANDGTLLLNGFRNADLRRLLFPQAEGDPVERRRSSARVSHRIAILAAHGLICRVPRSHRYRPTARGRRVATASVAARTAPISRRLS